MRLFVPQPIAHDVLEREPPAMPVRRRLDRQPVELAVHSVLEGIVEVSAICQDLVDLNRRVGKGNQQRRPRYPEHLFGDQMQVVQVLEHLERATDVEGRILERQSLDAIEVQARIALSSHVDLVNPPGWPQMLPQMSAAPTTQV